MIDTPVADEEYVRDLAMYWYFLELQFEGADSENSDELADELIKHGILLKKLLLAGGYTEANTLTVSVGGQTCFDVWLDKAGDITIGKLKRSGEENNAPYSAQ